ncbi:MAG: hypothetical protein JXM73_18345 [Anaerolineae bacterium]|nr:hypothetical protein [Anaerolineae bacterium]
MTPVVPGTRSGRRALQPADVLFVLLVLGIMLALAPGIHSDVRPEIVPDGQRDASYALLADDPSGDLGAPGGWPGAQWTNLTQLQVAADDAAHLYGYICWNAGEKVIVADIMGFDLYRADDPQGEPVRLNDTLIPAKQPGSPVGDQYQFVDRPLEPGAVYYYWLDCVHFDSSTDRNGPVSAAAGPYRFYLPLVFK